MSDLDRYLTDEVVEKAASAEWGYEWPDRPWEKTPDDLQDFYRSAARVNLSTVLPDIIQQALRDALARLGRAAHTVDSTHHFHGMTCLCGFEGDARKRTQTEHITAAVIEEYNRD